MPTNANSSPEFVIRLRMATDDDDHDRAIRAIRRLLKVAKRSAGLQCTAICQEHPDHETGKVLQTR